MGEDLADQIIGIVILLIAVAGGITLADYFRS